MATIHEFIERNHIRMTAERADRNPNMGDPNSKRDQEWNRAASHYKCRLRFGRRSLTTFFSQGSGISHEPTAEDVLDCLASDAAGVENARSFEEWADEYGYDTDSRRAERTYKIVERAAAKLRQFMGDEYEALLWKVERA